MARFCSECGEPTEGARFCPNCGIRLEPSPAPQRSGSIGMWLCEGGDSGRSNFNATDTAVSLKTVTDLRPRWNFRVDGGFPAQPIAVGGRIIVAAPREVGDWNLYHDAWGTEKDTHVSGGIHCFDAASGQLLWRNVMTGIDSSNMGWLIGSPIAVDDFLYCQFDGGRLWVLPVDSGATTEEILFSRWVEQSEDSSPTVASNTLILSGYDGVWTSRLPPRGTDPSLFAESGSYDFRDDQLRISGSVGVASDHLCFVSSDGVGIGVWDQGRVRDVQLCTYPAEIQHRLASLNEGACRSRGCTTGSDYFVARVRTDDYRQREGTSWILCGNAREGEMLWHRSARDGDFSDPALAPDMAIFGDSSGFVRAVDPETGADIWAVSTRSGSPALTTPLALTDLVIFGTASGVLTAVERATGQTVWEWDLRSPIIGSPLVVGGWLYVGVKSGLSAFSIWSTP